MANTENQLRNELHNLPEQGFDTPADAKAHEQSNYQSPHEKAGMAENREHDEHRHAEKRAELSDTTPE